MTVTAKVRVYSKTETGSGDNRQVGVRFSADYNDGRNKEWSLYTPSLDVTLTMKGEVADMFEIDKPYTLTFEPSES